MYTTQIQDYARQPLEAHGEKAAAEAAQKPVAFEKAGTGAGPNVAADRGGPHADARAAPELTRRRASANRE